MRTNWDDGKRCRQRLGIINGKVPHKKVGLPTVVMVTDFREIGGTTCFCNILNKYDVSFERQFYTESKYIDFNNKKYISPQLPWQHDYPKNVQNLKKDINLE
ncbi:Uncharacterised protein at_DN2610 [Pycnogonum litorale]